MCSQVCSWFFGSMKRGVGEIIFPRSTPVHPFDSTQGTEISAPYFSISKYNENANTKYHMNFLTHLLPIVNKKLSTKIL
jgi:hypothetical protein